MKQDTMKVSSAAHWRTGVMMNLMVGVLLLTLLAVAGRVVMLNHQPPQPLDRATAQRVREKVLPARRGALLDRKGRPLAVTRFAHQAFLDPWLIDEPGLFAMEVALVLEANPAEINRLLGMNAYKRYVPIRENLDERQLRAIRARIRSGAWRGVGIDRVAYRRYPHGEIAGQLLGFTGMDDHGHTDARGLEGLELTLNRRLASHPGQVPYVRDGAGRAVWVGHDEAQPPRDGEDVRLTLDLVIQQIAEKHLAEQCVEHHAKSAQAIVMDSRTGQLLAVAHWPMVDPNMRGRVTEDQQMFAEQAGVEPADLRRMAAVTDAYEPGSIFKPMIWAAAYDAGLIEPQDKVDCTDSGVWFTEFGRRLRDAHPHGRMTWAEVLIKSSNIGMGKLGLMMSPQQMREALTDFGFGASTRSGLPGEASGQITSAGQWTKYSQTSVPMGQEIATTPMQLVHAFSSFANAGRRVQPRILAEAEPTYHRACRADTADEVRMILRKVVTEGTGRRAKSELYRIWGKTGTAQVHDPVHGGYLDRTYTASFICGAPLVHPRIIVLVAVHQPDPDTGYYGGVVSAPVARSIVEETLTYLGVTPDVMPETP